MKELNFTKLLEDLTDALEKTDVDEEILQDEAPEAEVKEVSETPVEETEPEIEVEDVEFNDTMSLADKFDAKAKIARALDNLKKAVEEFKDATAEKVDLIQDADLVATIEALGTSVENVEGALAKGDLLKVDLNDPFNSELADEDVEVEVPEETEDTEEAEDEADLEKSPDADFDAEAGLQLIKSAEDEQV